MSWSSLKAVVQPVCFAVGVFLSGKKWNVFNNFMQYDIRPILKIELHDMPVRQEPFLTFLLHQNFHAKQIFLSSTLRLECKYGYQKQN